jgi:two-component system, NarL family, nitrate/nitrite response regulator NarL
MTRLHVLVCDDHRVMREALAEYLAAQPQVASVRVAADPDEATRLVREGGDVLVLDLKLADGASGLEVLEALQNLRIGIPVLVMSSTQDLDTVAQALALGALGYCPKTASPRALYDAVVEVASGRAVIPEIAVAPLLRKLLREQQSAHEAKQILSRLTARELDVLRLISQGTSRTDIARRLKLSTNTIRTHVRRLMEKLEVNTQLGAAARARELFDAVGAGARVQPPAAVIDLRPGAREDRLGR